MIDPIDRISVGQKNKDSKEIPLPLLPISLKTVTLPLTAFECFGKNHKYDHTNPQAYKHKPRVGGLPREVRSLLGGGLAQVTSPF